MPKRSKIDLLPEGIRKALERLLIEGAFSNYEGIAAWLGEQGYEISRSSAHRFGQNFQRSQAAVKAATDMAVSLTDNIGDDEGKLSDGVMRMYQQKLFQVLLDMEDIDPGDIDFIKLGRAIATVSRSSVNQKKWMAEIREKTKQTAEDVVQVAKKGGMSEKTAEEIRKKILGIV